MRLSPDMLIGYDRWGKAWSCAMLLDLRKKTKPLQCQDCDIGVRFLASVRFKRVFRSTITKRKFFLCPNCGTRKSFRGRKKRRNRCFVLHRSPLWKMLNASTSCARFARRNGASPALAAPRKSLA